MADNSQPELQFEISREKKHAEVMENDFGRIDWKNSQKLSSMKSKLGVLVETVKKTLNYKANIDRALQTHVF